MANEEKTYSYVLTGPEIELLEVIRLAHMPEFDLTVSRQNGVFTVKIVDIAGGRFREAHDATFEDAWRGLWPPLGGAGEDITLQDRIAARGLRVVEGEG